MTPRHRPLAENLRSVDPAVARLQTELIAALNRRVIDGYDTTARLATERDRRAATAWIQFRTRAHRIAVAPLLVDGALARVSGSHGRPDAAGAAASLARIEPLVAAMELVVGDELHPAGLDSDVDRDAVLVRLDASTPGGEMRNRLLVAVPADLTLSPIALPDVVPTAMTGLKLRWTARLAGPSIRFSRLGTIGAGDLIALGTGPLVARLALPGRNDFPSVRIDPIEGILTLQHDPARDDSIVFSTEAPSGTSPADLADLRIPTAIEIAGTSVTASELATLGEGSILPLPARGGALAVRVIAGDHAIAEGELVAVGQGFGVLLTAILPRKEG